jgi:hypothetical protein
MAVDAGLLADLAIGAMNAPHQKALRPTLFGPVITKQSQERLYHPLVGVVQTSLANLSPTDRQNVLSTRLAWVAARKENAESALGAIDGVATSIPSSLAQTHVNKPPSQGGPPYARFVWPLTTEVRVKDLWFRLLAGDPNGTPDATGDVVNTDRAFAALTDASVISDASQTAAATASLLLQLRCLADVYARWEMGARVAALVVDDQLSNPALTPAQMLARVLALARIEGDLSIPPEDDTLQGIDPGAASNIALPPGRAHFTYIVYPSAYMHCVTYLAVAKDYPKIPFPSGIFVPGFLTGWTLSDSATFKKIADYSFTIVLGGLDILWSVDLQTGAEQLAPGSPPFVSNAQFDWPALNRGLAGGLDNPRGAAQTDYETRMGLLTPYTAVAGPPAVVRMTACAASNYQGDYSGAGANYAALVVSEGVRYMNRLAYGPTRFGPGDTIATGLPEILVYLWYHTTTLERGANLAKLRGWKVGSLGAGLLSSAASSALRSSHVTPYSTALKAKLQGSTAWTPDLGDILDKIRNANKTDSPKLAMDKWPSIAPLLGDKCVVPALADYIRYEGDAVWKGWRRIRSNCIGYAQLYDYYVYQLTGSWPTP